MKVIHLSYGDAVWGASRAAYRIHDAIAQAGCHSEMWVDSKGTDDPRVHMPRSKVSRKLRAWLYRKIRNQVHARGYSGMVSPGLVPSRFSNRIAAAAPDVTHLHWVNFEMLSLGDIARLPGRTVWTMHDMWTFCGSDHYPDDDRWRTGYPETTTGFDFDRLVWRRKKKIWQKPMVLTAPSKWLADCARDSALMQGWRVEVVGNPIDCDLWHPVDVGQARAALEINPGKRVVLFGAVSSTTDTRKGYDLLAEAVGKLSSSPEDTELVVFGAENPSADAIAGYPVRSTGPIKDDAVLRQLYSAADVMVVPSRLEAFGQTASEAMACGTPVVAFDNTGLADVVEHGQTGYLARAFDTTDLAAGMDAMLGQAACLRDGTDPEGYKRLSDASRRRVLEHFSYPVVAARMLEIYETL